MPAGFLRNFLREVPIEYLYGVSRFELRARQGDVGHPFAVYWRDEKAIILYSMPMRWTWSGVSVQNRTVRHMRRFFATVEPTPQGLRVQWPHVDCLAIWFCTDVISHELGHHYRNQYRHRRPKAGSSGEEWIALLHENRFYRRLLRRMRARRESEGAA